MDETMCSFEGIYAFNGPVAQLVRAPPCHGGGHGFESRLGRFFGNEELNIVLGS